VRPTTRRVMAATAALMGLVLMAGACSGGPKSPSVAGGGPTSTANRASSGGPRAAGALAGMMAYSRCMRTHGIPDFPDPTPNPGGPGGSIQVNGGPGSDLNPHNPGYEAANAACQSLLPNGGTVTAPSASRLASEVKLAACMRTHGFPTFPDPNGQGAFVLDNFDMSSPRTQSAFKTCDSLTKFKGPMAVAISNQGP
jgi:hypothetical protein